MHLRSCSAYEQRSSERVPFSGTKGLLGRTHRQRRASADAGPVGTDRYTRTLGHEADKRFTKANSIEASAAL